MEGSLESVLQELQLVERKAVELDLELNCCKSDLICCDSSSIGTLSFQNLLVYNSQVRYASRGLGGGGGGMESICTWIKQTADRLI